MISYIGRIALITTRNITGATSESTLVVAAGTAATVSTHALGGVGHGGGAEFSPPLMPPCNMSFDVLGMAADIDRALSCLLLPLNWARFAEKRNERL